MPLRAQRVFVLAVVVLAVVAACRKKPPEPAVVPANNTPPETCDQRCRDSIAAVTARARADSIAKARADSIAAVERARSGILATLAEKVFFDYDQSVVTDESRAILDRKLPILRANAGLRLRISGHADERGSDEYNIALGQRRAAAVKRYLMDQGVDGGRIDIVSFGEERPAVQGGTEDAFAQNRRAEFEITAGADALTVPR
ncbi:MAG TPA: OmpA family protein [Gemmatimonadaceae bacterium]|nr:OmpA family protein [Gemmatimonadaceae bacterium]